MKSWWWKVRFTFWMAWHSRWIGGIPYFWDSEAGETVRAFPHCLEDSPEFWALECMSYWD